jgi:organic hydroperoxide reductase OsmC/OhrA
MPKALGGSGGPGSNPEQLFAAGYAGYSNATRGNIDVKHVAE